MSDICIVKESRERSYRVTASDVHISWIETGKIPRQPYLVRYKVDDQEYLALAGGFAWPGTQPGCAVVVGVQRIGESQYSYRALEEVTSNDIPPLMVSAYGLYRKWGWHCGAIPWRWYGDPQAYYRNFFSKFNSFLPKSAHKERHLRVNPTAHYEDNKKTQWGVLARVLYGLSADEGVLRFVVKDCPSVVSDVKRMADADVFKAGPASFPALAAFAYAVCSLHERRPWLAPPKLAPKLVNTIADKVEEMQVSYRDGVFQTRETDGYVHDLIPTVV
uniref:Terminase n=1 Tax=viral metagenome TaxID=1070528 RepID=A0A6M3JS95_9ZZZZ